MEVFRKYRCSGPSLDQLELCVLLSFHVIQQSSGDGHPPVSPSVPICSKDEDSKSLTGAETPTPCFMS